MKDRSGMSKGITAGGGGASLPGVTSGGPGVLNIAGTLEQQPGAGVTGALTTVRDDVGSTVFVVTGYGDGNGVEVAVGDETQVAQVIITTSSGSSLLYAFAIANTLGRVLNLMSDGTIKTVASFGIWGAAPPAAQPVLATGAGHTVDDIIALLQSYGLCKQS